MATSIDRVKQSIRERLEELDAERDQLLRALEALAGPGGSSVGGRRGRPPGSGTGRTGGATKRAAGKRAPRGQRRQQVIDVLQGGELGPSAIAREIGVNPTQVSGLLRQLATAGVVTRTAEGKWQLTGAGGAEPQQDSGAGSQHDSGAAPEANGSATPSQENASAGY